MLPSTLARLATRHHRRAAAVTAAAAAALPACLSLSLTRRPAASTSGTAAPSPRRLGDILHLDKLAGCSGPEVAAIWEDFHAVKKKGGGESDPAAAPSSPSTAHAFRLGSTLPAAAYATFKARAAASPLLALPLAKEAGKEEGGKGGGTKGLLTLVSQAQLPHLLIGTLAEFRAAGPAAPAHAVVTHYDELADEKGIVLVRTDLVSPHVLAPAEAASLVSTLHALYLDDEAGGGHALVRAFNHDPASFEWGALCKRLGVEVPAE